MREKNGNSVKLIILTIIVLSIVIVNGILLVIYTNNDFSFDLDRHIKKLVLNGVVDTIYININQHGSDYIKIRNFDSSITDIRLDYFSNEFSRLVSIGDTLISLSFSDSIIIRNQRKMLIVKKLNI